MADSDSRPAINGTHKVGVELEEWVQAIAEKAAWTVIKEHVQTCPIHDVQGKLDVLRMRFALLAGAILGSGILGGATGAAIAKALM